jgi:hypothetical protein
LVDAVVKFDGITNDIIADLAATKFNLKETNDGIADDLVAAISIIETTTDHTNQYLAA